eukprot:scaffold109934_cov18-Tisochrysis_lutea.AAC.1
MRSNDKQGVIWSPDQKRVSSAALGAQLPLGSRKAERPPPRDREEKPLKTLKPADTTSCTCGSLRGSTQHSFEVAALKSSLGRSYQRRLGSCLEASLA